MAFSQLQRVILAAIAGAILSVKAANAQQTIFNVPTGDIISHGQVFGQQQVDVNDEISSSTTLDYGLGKGWEVGLNLQEIELARIRQAEEDLQNPALPPLFTANLQKSWDMLPEELLFSLGTQQGIALGEKALGRYAGMNWGILEVTNKVVEGLELVAGVYQAHWNVVGNGDKFHGMAGLEYQLLKPVHVSADWKGGNNQVGGATLGITLFALPKLPLSVGYHFANSARGREGLTFQLTYHP